LANRFSIEAIFKGHDRLSGIFARIEGNAGRMARMTSRAFARVEGATAGVDRMMRTAGVTALAAGAVVGAGMAKIATSANEVEDSLAAVATVITPVAGTIQSALAETKRAAIDWSKSHADSADTFIRASYDMSSAGLDSAQAIAGTRAALTLATGALGDPTTASNLLAVVFQNLGDKAADSTAEMTRLSDVLAKTQAVFAIKNLEQLNESLKMAAPSAIQFGVSVEQVSNAVGTLNSAGLQGSQAGTAFSATLRQMLKASKALRFEIAKTESGGIDFAGTITNIEKRFGSFAQMSDETKGKFQQVFGDEGVRAVALMLGKTDLLRQNLDKVTNSAGAAAEAAAKIEGTRSKRLEIMGNRIKAVAISLGDALLPLLDPVVTRIGGVVDATGRWVDANRALISASPGVFASGFAEALGSVRDAAQAVLGPLGGVRDVLAPSRSWSENVRDLGKGFGFLVAATGGFVAFSVAVKGARAAVFLFEIAMAAANLATGAVGGLARGAAAAHTILTGATTTSTGATWLGVAAEKARAGALAFSRFATTRLTFATIASEGASKAAALATRGWASAVEFYTLVTKRQTFATLFGRAAAIASRGAEILLAGARWAGRTAVDAYAIARGRATAAEISGAASAGAANLALAPLLLTLGAITLAIGAAVAAWKQWESLDKAAGGHAWEGVKGFVKGDGFFATVDEAMNRDARAAFDREQAAKASGAGQMVSPQERVARSVSESRTEEHSTAEVTIKDETRRAQVTKKPKGKVPIRLEPSGAF